MNSNKKILEKVRDIESRLDLDLSDIKILLEDNIREESAKKSKRGKSELTIVKSLFKDEFYKTNQNMINKTFMTNNEFYSYMTLHRVFYTRTDLGYEVTENPFSNRIDFVSDFGRDILDNPKMVELSIDVSNLMFFIDTLDKKNNKPYIMHINKDGKHYYLGVNPHYLLDALKFTNTTKIYTVLKTGTDNRTITCPIYTMSKDNNGLMDKLVATLPVHCGSEPQQNYNYVV